MLNNLPRLALTGQGRVIDLSEQSVAPKNNPEPIPSTLLTHELGSKIMGTLLQQFTPVELLQ